MTRAAQRLGLSQPTVSRSLAQLRALLGDPLLVRSSGGMALTRRAEDLAKPLESWLSMTSTLLKPSVFDPASLDRHFRLASTDFGVLSVISPALPLVQQTAPGVRIDVSPFSTDMGKRLVSGELDLIVSGMKPDPSQTHMRHLFRETFSCVVRAGHPLASRAADAEFSLDEYLEWPHIAISVGDQEFDHVQSCLGEHGKRRRILTRVPYFYAAPDFLGSSDALLTLPSRAARRFAQLHGFVCLPVPPIIEGFDYWVLWHERSARDSATLWLVDMLAEATAPEPE